MPFTPGAPTTAGPLPPGTMGPSAGVHSLGAPAGRGAPYPGAGVEPIPGDPNRLRLSLFTA